MEKIQNEFKNSDFFEKLNVIALKLVLISEDNEIIRFIIEIVIKTVEIVPSQISKVSPNLIFGMITKFDMLQKSNNTSLSQILYESICQYFELLVLHEVQCRTFKFLLSEMIGKIFEEDFHSINFVLIFTKIMTQMHRISVI